MRLIDYLKKEHISRAKFARMLRLHAPTVRSYVSGYRFPSYQTSKAIEAITEGEVTIDDLMENRPKPQRCPTCDNILDCCYTIETCTENEDMKNVKLKKVKRKT
ncbi:MAG: hypothetical protein PHV42_04295 [Candidatus Pacebacteria bacterium]|nr:hypothetical protein [Candidatus Paceibacterota bacterium]